MVKWRQIRKKKNRESEETGITTFGGWEKRKHHQLREKSIDGKAGLGQGDRIW